MLGGYRGVFAALAGIAAFFCTLGAGAFFGALYAPHYGYQATGSSYRASQSKEGNPSQIDRDRAGLPYAAERIASGPDPENADEREKRDLAAQEASALWAFWILMVSVGGVMVTTVGTGFLLWQIMLTREAVQDTGKATEAMLEANKIAREAQRPWLSVEARLSSKIEPGRTHLGVDGFYFEVAGVIKNHGDTPATDIHIIVDMVVPQAGVEPRQALHDYGDRWRQKAFKGGPALFAGQDREFEHMVFISQSDIDLALSDCGDFKMIAPFVVGCISYRSGHVEGVRQTRFLYHVATSENGTVKVIRPDNPDWWKGNIGLTDHETVYAD